MGCRHSASCSVVAVTPQTTAARRGGVRGDNDRSNEWCEPDGHPHKQRSLRAKRHHSIKSDRSGGTSSSFANSSVALTAQSVSSGKSVAAAPVSPGRAGSVTSAGSLASRKFWASSVDGSLRSHTSSGRSSHGPTAGSSGSMNTPPNRGAVDVSLGALPEHDSGGKSVEGSRSRSSSENNSPAHGAPNATVVPHGVVAARLSVSGPPGVAIPVEAPTVPAPIDCTTPAASSGHVSMRALNQSGPARPWIGGTVWEVGDDDKPHYSPPKRASSFASLEERVKRSRSYRDGLSEPLSVNTSGPARLGSFHMSSNSSNSGGSGRLSHPATPAGVPPRAPSHGASLVSDQQHVEEADPDIEVVYSWRFNGVTNSSAVHHPSPMRREAFARSRSTTPDKRYRRSSACSAIQVSRRGSLAMSHTTDGTYSSGIGSDYTSEYDSFHQARTSRPNVHMDEEDRRAAADWEHHFPQYRPWDSPARARRTAHHMDIFPEHLAPHSQFEWFAD